jgi:hypothetical protein
MSELPPPSAAEGGAGLLDDDDPQPLSVGRRLGRLLAIIVAVGLAALWVYALWGPVQRTAQGELDADTFPAAAEPICAAAMLRIDDLPKAFESTENEARARAIEAANADLAQMLDQLDAIAPSATDGDDGRMVDEWLADWRTYLGDRANYAERLATDPDARMLVTEKDSRQISEPIDYFARVNDMPNCGTAGDVA